MSDAKAANSREIVVEREFDAPREQVWQAWTDPKMVQRWYGPDGFTAPSIKIDLRVGGQYIWSMRGPAGSPMDMLMHVAGTYKEIVPNQKLVVVEHMSDERGNKIEMPGRGGAAPSEMIYTVLFEELERGRTRLSITYPAPRTEEEYQALLKGGMVEGWNGALGKLVEALK